MMFHPRPETALNVYRMSQMPWATFVAQCLLAAKSLRMLKRLPPTVNRPTKYEVKR